MNPLPYYTDFHCHPTSKPFQCSHHQSIWDGVNSTGQQILYREVYQSRLPKDIPFHLPDSSSSHISLCKKGKIKQIFISLCPPETSFFNLTESQLTRGSVTQALELFSGLTQIDINTVKNYHSRWRNREEREYYAELEQEYAYIVKQSQEYERGGLVLGEDQVQVRKALSEAEDQIVVIVTVEGGHSLGTYIPAPKGSYESVTSNLAQYSDNIQRLKAWGNGRHSPLFLSLANHFWNGLCGHARSFDGIHKFMSYNQEPGINQGISKLGYEVIEQLLSRQNGRRILIDVKNMSANSRKEFYTLWEHYSERGDSFPIICSSTAVNGISKLSQSLHTPDNFLPKDQYFNTWSINMYDEDLQYIFQSGGILGLILDEFQMPGSISRNLIHKHRMRRNSRLQQAEYIRLLMANVFHIVRTLNHPKAWDMICIGSNQDGINHQFEIFPNIASLPDIADQIFQFLLHPQENPHIHPRLTREEMQRLMFWFTPEEIVAKIMYQNVSSFLEQYYHENYLLHPSVASLVQPT